MNKVNELNLQEFIGKTIDMVLWLKGNLTLKLEDDLSFDILSHRSFWRISDGSGILLTSEDFFVKTTDEIGYDFIPVSDQTLEQFKESAGEDYELSDLYDYLDDIFEEREEKLRQILENETVESASEQPCGDFKLVFKSGITLEAFAGSDYFQNPYPHLYVFSRQE